MINNPTGRIDRSRNNSRSQNPGRYEAARDSYSASLQASIERREKRRREEEDAKRQAELQAQKDAAQAQRDKQQQKYGQADTAQRAYYAANEAADDFNRTKQLNRQQQKDVRRRDTLNNDFTLIRDREQARDQQDQDTRRFGFSTKENEQKFGYQTMENEQQFGHQVQRDRFQHGNTMDRDAAQFGYDSIRAQQQHGNTMERDGALNEFDTQRDVRQNQFQGERDNRLNMFDTQRDARQQKYTQQNQAQRETAEVAARWQEQIQQARNAGMDFSEQQKQEMKDLDRAFRKNVLADEYLDEGLKQQAMLLHQKQLAAIVPDEKAANPQEGLQSSLIFHEPTKTWFMQGRDSKGFPTYEPVGSGGDGGMAEQQKMQQLQQEKMRQQQEKQSETTRKAMFDRQNEFSAIVREKMNETDDLGNKTYPDRQSAIEAAKNEYAPMEQLWRQEHKLPPLYVFQEEADAIRNQQQAPPDNGNPYRRPQQGQPSAFSPATGQKQRHVPGMADSARLRNGDEMPKPVTMSATNIDSHMEKTMAGGDKEAAAALQTVKLISAKNNGGPPPAGSQDLMDMVKAIKFLRSKGIAIQGEAGKSRGMTSEPSGTQLLFDAGWR